MGVMTTGSDPGEHRLARPPSDRYRSADSSTDVDADAGPTGSAARGVLFGVLAMLAGVLVTVLLGGGLALSAGLLVIWAAGGNAIGLATRIGGGPALTAPQRTGVAVGLALAGVALGQVALWWYAGTEGGVLPLMDFLGQTYGVLVPVQVVLAAGFAWWAAR